MSDDKQRYLIVPSTVLDEVAAAPAANEGFNTFSSARDNDEQSQGIVAKQPVVSGDAKFTLRASGTLDSQIELSGTDFVETAHVGITGQVIRGGVTEDARFSWLRDGDRETTSSSSGSGWQMRQSPLVASRAYHLLTHSSLAQYEDRPWRVQPKMIVLGDGRVQCYSIESARSPVSLWSTSTGTRNFGVPGSWQNSANRVILDTLEPFPQRTWTKGAVIDIGRTVQAFTAACIPGTSDVIQVGITDTGVGVYIQPNGGNRQRRAMFGFSPWNYLGTQDTAFRFRASTVYSCDCAFLPNGRFVLVVAHRAAVDAFVSDDLGLSWQRSTILECYDTDKDSYLDVNPGSGNTLLRTIRTPHSTTPLPLEGVQPSPSGTGNVYYERVVAPNEHCDISLCVAANGNLVLGLVYPSYRNLINFVPGGSSPGIQSYCSNAMFSTILSAVSVYCSVDGLTWGGDTQYIYDSPAVNGDSELEIIAGPYFVVGGGGGGVGSDPIVYESNISATFPDNKISSDPNISVIWKSEAGPLPAYISVSLGSEGYVDIYLTTMPAWMAPYLTYGASDYTDEYTQMERPATAVVGPALPFYRLSTGKLLLQHRRFSTKEPTPAENTAIWFPTTGNVLARFHPMQVRSVRAVDNGDVLWLGSGGYAGGIAAVNQRGSTLLLTNGFARIVTEPATITEGGVEEGTNEVGQMLLEVANWQPLTEVLGWGRAVIDPTYPIYTDTSNSPPGFAQGRIYGTVWDCANTPNYLGWAAVINDTGANALAVSNASNRGYLATTVGSAAAAGNAHYILYDELPNANGSDKSGDDPVATGLQSVVRFCVKLVSGTFSLTGSTDLCAVGVRLRGGGIGQHSLGYEARFRISGSDVDMVLYDTIAGAAAISPSSGILSNAVGKWVEVVVTTRLAPANKTEVQVFLRIQEDLDPDFEQPYSVLSGELLLKALATSGDLTAFADSVWFGLKDVHPDAAEVHWNYLAIHRPTTAPATRETIGGNNLTRRSGYLLSPTTNPSIFEQDLVFGRLYCFDFETEANNSTTASLLYNNSGVLSGMLGGQLSTTPVWVSRGMQLSAYGEFTPQTTFRWDSGPEYDWRNALIHPVMKEWRGPARDLSRVSEFDDEYSATLTLDIPTNRDLRPQAIAMLGRNSPNISVYFRQPGGVDALLKVVSPALQQPTWVPPDSPVTSTDAVVGHYWGHNGEESGPALTLNRNRVSFMDTTGTAPVPFNAFRSNQFAQNDKGPVWYFAYQLVSDSEVRNPILVYRIKNNGSNWLELEIDIDADLAALGEKPESGSPKQWVGCVYSDRFAVDIDALISDTFVASGFPTREIDQIIIRFHEASFRDPDHAFHRLGRVILGDLIDLSEPDCEWAWSIQASSGNRIYKSNSGPSFSTASSPTVRQFNCAYPLTAPADLPADQFGVARDQTSGTWRHKIDILNRLQMDGREAVLVWQGEQLNHAPVSGTVGGYPTVSDPLDIMMVRAGSSYTLQHQQYQGTLLTRRNATQKCVPLPYVAVGGIVFTEEF